MTDEPTLSALMAAAQTGDKDSYALLLRTVESIALRFVRRRLSSEDAAHDVCQEVLMTIHRARHTYDARRPFEPWLFSIIRVRLIDHLRRERRISRFEVLTDAFPDVQGESDIAIPVDLAGIVDKLPPDQREAFVMVQLRGMTTEEAARTVGVNVSALKVRAHRAYKGLKQALGAEDPNESN